MLNMSPLNSAAGLGRKGDNMLGHLTSGELVIPKSAQTPGLVAEFAQTMRRRGVNPAEFVAGSRLSSRNPMTGLAEFADPLGMMGQMPPAQMPMGEMPNDINMLQPPAMGLGATLPPSYTAAPTMVPQTRPYYLGIVA